MGWPWAHCGVHLLCHIGKAVFFQIYAFQCFFRGINKHFKSSFVTDLITSCHHLESISNSWQWETPCHEQYARGTLEKRKRFLKWRNHPKHHFLGSLPPRGWTYRKMCKKNLLSSIHSFLKFLKDCNFQEFMDASGTSCHAFPGVWGTCSGSGSSNSMVLHSSAVLSSGRAS